jgi:hypothetical protein
MSAPPQAIAPNPHTNLLNVYIQIENKMGFQKKKKSKGGGSSRRYEPDPYAWEAAGIALKT